MQNRQSGSRIARATKLRQWAAPAREPRTAATQPGLRDWRLLAAAALIFSVYVTYTLAYALLLPYPGWEFDGSWTVIATCPADWCDPQESAPLELGDQLLQIGALTREAYLADRNSVPLEGLAAGAQVELRFARDGREATALHTLPIPRQRDIAWRLVATVFSVPFWAAGTAVLLLLRPRNQSWRLLTALFYLIALWIVLGLISVWHLWGSSPAVRALSWLLGAVLIHTHWQLPGVMRGRRQQIGAGVLYSFAAVMALAEMWQRLPDGAYLTGLAAQIGLSLIILLARRLRARSAELIAVRLMLLGLTTAFVPGLIVVLSPPAISGDRTILNLALLACTTFPAFYIYAAFKRQLGASEFRANRLLGRYAFASIFISLFVFWIAGALRFFGPSPQLTTFNIFSLLLATLLLPGAWRAFERWFNRLAYGTEYNVDQIVAAFANRIPTVLDRAALVQLLTGDIMPSLLIRESALATVTADGATWLYRSGDPQAADPPALEDVAALLQTAGRYRPLDERGQNRPLAWVRLALRLSVGERTVGVWLFGRRDPDDYYAQSDIALLQTLANQLAPTLENIELYETLRQYAGELETEVARRTADLETAKQRTEAILEGAGEGIFFADADGRLLYANPALRRLVGREADALLGSLLHTWVAPTVAGAAETADDLRRAMQLRSSWSGAVLCERSNGSRFDAALTLTPVAPPGAPGDPAESGFVGILSDISHIKELERLKDHFVSNVTHELRTPLTNIRTYVDLMEVGKPEKRARYRQVVDREIARLVQLIEDLLNLARLDAQQTGTAVQAIDAVALAHGVATQFAVRAQDKQMAIQVETEAAEPLTILANPPQIATVLTNLVGNALTYCPPGSSITVTLRRDNGARPRNVQIAVRDNGPGIPADELEHLFERFYRGRSGRESSAAGTGLGLAICREIVRRHHGAITVESEEGKGSTFQITLPAA